jgi:hypothetical protein
MVSGLAREGKEGRRRHNMKEERRKKRSPFPSMARRHCSWVSMMISMASFLGSHLPSKANLFSPLPSGIL